MIRYGVRIETPSLAIADELLVWLTHDHVGEVVRAGAIDAEVVQLEPTIFEVRYRFASREAFDAYDRGPAERLRAEGRARFGPERGVRMSRSIGEIVLTR